jgi:putative endonuclease
MYYCYIVRCADDTLYTGVTTDLARRVEEHNQGKGARYTAPRRPVELMWSERLANRSLAQRREAEIKRWGRERKEALIEKGKKALI